MRIGIDFRDLLSEQRGIGLYVFSTILNLLKIDKENQYFLYIDTKESHNLQPKKYLPVLNKFKTYPNVKIIDVPSGGFFLWEQILFPLQIKKDKIDICHTPSNWAPLFCTSKRIMTLHDDYEFRTDLVRNPMNFWDLKVFLYRKMMLHFAFRKVSKILTVSRFIKDEIATNLNLPKAKIISIYNGFNHFARTNVKKSNFILLLGGTAPNKNTSSALRAYSNLPLNFKKKYNLIVIGEFDGKLKQMIRTLGIERYVLSKNYLDSSILAKYYANSALFIYPSLTEGFGIPPLEAMSCGTPVVASNGGAIPEVCGNAAVYFDPNDINEMAAKIELVLGNKKLQKQLIKRGFGNIKRFSWEKTAKETLNIYNSVMISE